MGHMYTLFDKSRVEEILSDAIVTLAMALNVKGELEYDPLTCEVKVVVDRDVDGLVSALMKHNKPVRRWLVPMIKVRLKDGRLDLNDKKGKKMRSFLVYDVDELWPLIVEWITNYNEE